MSASKEQSFIFNKKKARVVTGVKFYKRTTSDDYVNKLIEQRTKKEEKEYKKLRKQNESLEISSARKQTQHNKDFLTINHNYQYLRKNRISQPLAQPIASNYSPRENNVENEKNEKIIQQREVALTSLQQNLKDIEEKLEKNSNYKRFFWTPDFTFCGFATAN